MASKKKTGQSYKNRFLLICTCLVLAILAVYWPVYSYQFVAYDDDVYVSNNPNIQSGLNWTSIRWAFTTGRTGNWHPVTWLSLILDYQFFKNWAGGYHLVNVSFHIVNTLVLFYVLVRMTGAVWPSAFVAAAFALHPFHVESVAWVAERKDVLSTFFWLLTMLAYTRYVENRNLRRYLATFALFVIGLMAKPMLVTLPFVLLLLDFWPLERKFTWRLLVEKIPFFICSIGSCIATFFAQQRSGAMAAIEPCGLMTRISNAVVSYVTYIAKTIWPNRLAVLYPHPENGLPTTKVFICVLALVLISICCIYAGRRYKFFAVGWFWYLGTLVPVIGLVQVGAQAMADRYTYMTLTGLFIIIAWSAKEFVSKQQYKILALLAVVVLVAWGAAASRQLRYWKDSQTLFEHTLAVTKNNYIIHTNYITYLNGIGRLNEVIEQSYELLKIKPDSAETHNNLGIALANTGRPQDAIEHFRLAVKYNPDYLLSYFNLAVALQNEGRLEEAVSYYKQVLKVKPDHINACLNLAAALVELDRPDEAVEPCNKVLELEPDNIKAHQLLEDALKKRKTP
jgi:hypothetical protein